VSAPTFQLYVRDWYVSTRGLTAEARGVFMDLLCLGWDHDGIPDDQKVLAGMVGESPARFKRIWAEIEPRWVAAEKGRLRNPRQERQRAELMELREKKRAAGRASAAARNGSSR
jgi:uncharacterized protein YdaU (DUF1376 family)